MLVIPVIDLMGGMVVHARRGDRSNYAPLVTSLCPSSEPLAVVAALLGLVPFRTLYVADLDAIGRTGEHLRTLQSIREQHPQLALWVDAGCGSMAALQPWLSLGVTPVVGSESLPSLAAFEAIRDECPQAVLSLDTRGGVRLGPATIFARPTYWPDTVIVMTLDRVGAGCGPAVDTLAAVVAQAAPRKVVAAGGVRDAADLGALERLGVYAALVASAIHDGSLDRGELDRYLFEATD